VPYQYRDHALFVAFAPYERPEVAVSVIIEHGEHGGAAAAPIAGRILRKYFEGKGVIKKPVLKDEPENQPEETTAPEMDEKAYLPASISGHPPAH
jgi:penicillin-binding protein 2